MKFKSRVIDQGFHQVRPVTKKFLLAFSQKNHRFAWMEGKSITLHYGTVRWAEVTNPTETPGPQKLLIVNLINVC